MKQPFYYIIKKERKDIIIQVYIHTLEGLGYRDRTHMKRHRNSNQIQPLLVLLRRDKKLQGLQLLGSQQKKRREKRVWYGIGICLEFPCKIEFGVCLAG